VTLIFKALSISKKKYEEEQLQLKKKSQQLSSSNKKSENDPSTASLSETNESSERPKSDSIVDSPADCNESSNGEGGSGGNSTIAGADDFLPLLIWVVVQSKVPRLFSNCEYIQTYLNPARLMSKSGYCLINLRSAIEFLAYLEPTNLNMDIEEFERKYAEAETKVVSSSSSS
jgi:hypothetical protein